MVRGSVDESLQFVDELDAFLLGKPAIPSLFVVNDLALVLDDQI